MNTKRAEKLLKMLVACLLEADTLYREIETSMDVPPAKLPRPAKGIKSKPIPKGLKFSKPDKKGGWTLTPKVPGVKPPKAARKWKCDIKVRGRVPTWVLSQTKTKDKAEVVEKFGNGFKFVEGVTPEIGA